MNKTWKERDISMMFSAHYENRYSRNGKNDDELMNIPASLSEYAAQGQQQHVDRSTNRPPQEQQGIQLGTHQSQPPHSDAFRLGGLGRF